MENRTACAFLLTQLTPRGGDLFAAILLNLRESVCNVCHETRAPALLVET